MSTAFALRSDLLNQNRNFLAHLATKLSAAAHLCPPTFKLQTTQSCLALYMGASDLNSGLYMLRMRVLACEHPDLKFSV